MDPVENQIGFFEMKSIRTSLAVVFATVAFLGGMKVDVEGNIYCGGSGGLYILDPSGIKLGIIEHGATATTNLAFGGDDWKTLYFTSRNHLGSVKVSIPGNPVPAVKK